jgi:hypothetical protein
VSFGSGPQVGEAVAGASSTRRRGCVARTATRWSWRGYCSPGRLRPGAPSRRGEGQEQPLSLAGRGRASGGRPSAPFVGIHGFIALWEFDCAVTQFLPRRHPARRGRRRRRASRRSCHQLGVGAAIRELPPYGEGDLRAQSSSRSSWRGSSRRTTRDRRRQARRPRASWGPTDDLRGRSDAPWCSRSARGRCADRLEESRRGQRSPGPRRSALLRCSGLHPLRRPFRRRPATVSCYPGLYRVMTAPDQVPPRVGRHCISLEPSPGADPSSSSAIRPGDVGGPRLSAGRGGLFAMDRADGRRG